MLFPMDEELALQREAEDEERHARKDSIKREAEAAIKREADAKRFGLPTEEYWKNTPPTLFVHKSAPEQPQAPKGQQHSYKPRC